MSTTIDQRVIQMKFDNDEFEKRTAKTLGTLAELKSKMNFDGAKRGLTDLNAAAKGFSLEGIGRGVDEIKNKFSALSIVGITALANIANRAVNMGASIVKSLTIGPISQGFSDYNTKLTSVQTIMNATGADINKVNGYFNQLDTYADKTIYNLTDMTSAFAKFTNAGIPMQKSVPAIKGIANMTALAGQGAEAAQIAYYNLSQSLSGGFLTTIDYKSLNLANIATVEWKNQVINAAIAAGKLKQSAKGVYHIPGVKNAYTMQSLFTEGLSKQWATTDVLTKVLGDYGNTQTAIGKKAQAAAQNVKSLPMMMTTLKESVGTGWTQSFEYIFGNVKESTKLFTGMTNAIQSVLDKASFGRNHMLHQWKDLGGRTAIIDAVANTWKALGAILKPIGDAFREVFPPGAGKALADLSFKIRELTKHFMISGDTAQRIKSTFEGVFSIFKIGIAIVKGLLKGFFGLFTTLGTTSGGILAVTATVGEFIRKISDLLLKTGAIDKFFAVFVAPLGLIKPFIGLISNLAGALSVLFMGDVSGFTSRFNAAFKSFGDAFAAIGDKLNNFVEGVSGALANVVNYLFNFASAAQNSGNAFIATWATRLANLAMYFYTFVQNVQKSVGNFISNMRDVTTSGSNFLSAFGLGLFSPIIVGVGNLVGSFKELKASMDMGKTMSTLADGTSAVGTSFAKMGEAGHAAKNASGEVVTGLSAIGGSFGPVLSGLRDFFTTVVSKITEWVKNMNFQDILALINTGVFILMYRAVTRISNSIAQTFEQLTNTLKSMQQNVKANVILKIAIAVGILVTSLMALSRIDPKSLSIALGALTAVFVELGAALKFMSFDQKGLLRSGAGMVLLATAIRILVSAVSVLGKMNLVAIVQGVGTLGIMLAMLVASATAMETALPGARAIVIIAGALAVLTPVLITLGLIPLHILAQGLGVVAAALIILSVAANGMIVALPGAKAILILAGALFILTPVLISFGLMPWENIGKAMVVLAATLTMLVIAASSMTAALPGAMAILILAGALALLAPALIMFGMMKWEAIGKGLVMLAGVFAIFVIAMYALTPVIVILAAFSGSIVLLGAGLLLAGAGMLLFSTALAALAVSGAAGFIVLMGGIHAFLAMLPLIAQQFGLALVAFAVVLGAAAPKLVQAFVAIIIAMLKGLQKLIPEFIKTMGIALMALVNEIAKRAPQIWEAGLKMLIGILTKIRDNIGKIAQLGVEITVEFMKGIRRGLPDLLNQAFLFIIDFINGLAKGIDTHADQLGEAGVHLAKAIIDGLIKGLKGLGHLAVDAAKNLGKSVISGAGHALGINSPSKEFIKIGEYVNEGFAKGLTGSKDQVLEAMSHVTDLITKAKESAVKDVTDLNTKLSKLNHELLVDDKAIADQRKKLAEAQNRSEAEAFAGKKKVTDAQRKAWEADQNKDVKAAQDRLDKLTYARNQDAAAIRTATAALVEAKKEQKAAAAAQVALTSTYANEVTKLQALADAHEALKTKIEEANKAVEDAIKTRDDYKKSITDSFNALPDINKDTTLADYVLGMQAKEQNVAAFSLALQQLREYGLSDAMYQEFLKKGIDSLPFIQEVLQGGQASVTLLNESSRNLATAAQALGQMASVAMYQAGVDTAQGLLNGLKSQEAELVIEMQRIADILTQTANKKLKIKSPSRVFMQIGAFTVAGLAKGLKDNSFLAENVAGDIGQNVVDALVKTISNMSDLVPMNMDMQPTITPILDLSNIKKDSALLDSLLPSQQLNVESAYSRAVAANAGYVANQQAAASSDPASVDSPVGDVIFNQTITSPKAISTADVYRNTNNQISQAKGALTGAKPS